MHFHASFHASNYARNYILNNCNGILKKIHLHSIGKSKQHCVPVNTAFDFVLNISIHNLVNIIYIFFPHKKSIGKLSES